jgi:oligopeptide transport system ATP-binding protein
LLAVDDLRVHLFTSRGVVRAVDGVSFSVEPGKSLGIVGESGCGKTMTALAMMRLIPSPPARIVSGRISFDGQDVVTMDAARLRALRGGDIAMIYQDPMTSLNPVFKVGEQIAEAVRLHRRDGNRAAWLRAVEMLRVVGIPDPARVAEAYPHQLSGGMRQRVLIAMALACQPSLVIADEPTTALDVTIQAEILDLLREMKSALELSLLLITHDLGVVAETADRVAVMYAGRIVEEGPVRAIFRNPKHPYTQGLLASLPGGAAGGRLHAIEGSVPQLGALPPGCAFNPRCPSRFELCVLEPPPDYDVGPDQRAKCYLHAPAAHADGSVRPGSINPIPSLGEGV